MTRHDHPCEDTPYECIGPGAEKRRCVNCCVGGIMSRCGAGPRPADQARCRFFKRSTTSDRCMHYIVALDGHCDSVDAQRARQTAGPPKSCGRG